MKKLYISTRAFIILATLFLAIFSISAKAQNIGSLDPTFGTAGKVTTSIRESAYFSSIVIQSDGKIVGGGNSSSLSEGAFALVRYNTEGNLDTSFGNNGIVIDTIAGRSSHLNSIAIQNDGKIVAAGYSQNHFFLARYYSDGNIDTLFGNNGVVATSFSNFGRTEINAIAIQNDGKIIAAGYGDSITSYCSLMVRYNANGGIDTTFGNRGVLFFPIGEHLVKINSLAIQSDGKIIAAGYAFSTDGTFAYFALARHNSDGSLDNSFGTNGKVISAIGLPEDEIFSIAIQSDGKIVAAGYSVIESIKKLSLVRYNSNGSLDNMFGSGGKVITDFGTTYVSFSQASSVVIQNDGKIVAAGYFDNSSICKFAVARYNSNGTPDITFDNDGKVITQLGVHAECHGLAIQSDGKIVAAGEVLENSVYKCGLVRYIGKSQPIIYSHPQSLSMCQNQSVTFSVNANGDQPFTYQWYYNSNAISNSNNSTLIVNSITSVNAGNYYCIVSNSLGNDTSNIATLSVKTLPTNAGAISGITNVCKGQNAVLYNIPVINEATSYIWTLPSGATGSSTSNSISLNFDTTAVSGNITVKGKNICGNGVASTLAITVNSLPTNAGGISGLTAVCQGQNSVTYTVPGITNAASYVWTLPNGVTGSSTTNSITVDFGTSAVSGNITVKGINTCGVGTISTLAVTVNPLPASAEMISGITTVCQGQNSVTYTVPEITNAVSYVWNLPNGVTGSSTTNSITVDFGTSAVSGDISVKGNNTCGNGTISTLAITVNPIPASAEMISGMTTVCKGQNGVTYSIPSIANASSYSWSLPIGAFGSSSTESITIDYNENAISGNISVKGVNICGSGDSSTLAINVESPVSDAGQITGLTVICQGQNSVIYTVPEIANAASYVWNLPNGVTGSSTTNSITVDFGTTAVSGNITVKGINTCGVGTISTLPVTVNPLPASAEMISGLTTVCQGQNSVTYTVPEIANAASSVWILPNGVTGSSTTNSITVDFGTTAVSGNITVKGINTCGVGTISTLPVTVNPLPASAEMISGLTTVCQGQNSVTYTVPEIANAASYIWNLPNGVTGSSTTKSITVDFQTTAVSGDISVKGINSCGDGATSSLAISVNPIPASAEMISGTTTVCQGQNSITYTVPEIANAASYIWNLPNGVTGSSTTNSITVDFQTTAVSGDISVKGINSCGDGTISTLAITVNPTPASAEMISGTTTVCQGQNSITYTVPEIANAASYIWNLPNGVTGSSTTNSITVDFGTTAVSGDISVKGINSCGDGATSSLAITVNPFSASAEMISGTTTVCQGQNPVTYTVPEIANAASYVWNLPNGVTGSSTTNSITVDFGATAVSGDISVKGINPCGDGAISTLAITINPIPASATEISGLAEVFQNQSDVIYSIPAISNATSYIWTLPQGATGTSTTNTISVNYGSSAVSGYITVKGVNVCGEGLPASLLITVDSLPDNAGSISGLSTVHQTESGVVYTVPEIANATSYIWTLPNGASSSKSTNSITVNFGDNAESGEITVKGRNAHGDGIVSTLPVIVIPTPTAPVITLNGLILNSNVSDGNQWYNQNGLINGATEQSYLATTNGVYYAKAFVDGWSSAPSNNIEISTVNIENQEENLRVRIYPNPINDELIIESTNEAEAITFEIINSIGQTVYNGEVKNKTRVKTDFFSSGLYVVKIKNGNAIFLTKIVKE